MDHKTKFKIRSIGKILPLLFFSFVMFYSGYSQSPNERFITAKEILGNPDYPAISYGGYRGISLDMQPTIAELKEDMKILSAMGIKVLRTYKLLFPHAENVLKAIRELKSEDPEFEMYVMLGAWIDCMDARTVNPVHNEESEENAAEIDRAIAAANAYPDIVKVIAVGNEAMVKWAEQYYVEPSIILKWVKHLQKLKANNKLPENLWITSSDNFASWGGGGSEYHVPELIELIKTVDFISMHTYPMHDTHYNPAFWRKGIKSELNKIEQIDAAMKRALEYSQLQYKSVKAYMKSLGVDKPIHIGETGWASVSNGFYGPNGSKACDEYKQALFYNHLRDWTNKSKISCFFFEAFDEPWKDAKNPNGSENHFGLFTVDGKAKYVIWDLVDNKIFDGLRRGGNKIIKTYEGNREALLNAIVAPDGK